MGTVPRLLGAAVLVVAVVAHALGVVGFVLVSTLIDFLPK